MKRYFIKQDLDNPLKSRNLMGYLIFLLLFGIIFVNCKTNKENELKQNKIYVCKDFELIVPMEIYGEESGYTHFHSSLTESEIFYSFDSYLSKNEAAKKFAEKTHEILINNSEIRKSVLKDHTGEIIGEKIVYQSEDLEYNLLWTNELKFNLLTSHSLKAIEEIEKECNF